MVTKNIAASEVRPTREVLAAVRFSKAQLAYLEELFPEQVLAHTATEAFLRHYHGSRAVVAAVRHRTEG